MIDEANPCNIEHLDDKALFVIFVDNDVPGH